METFQNVVQAVIKVLSENLKVIMVGVISILMVVAAAIVISLYFGGDVGRTLVVSEISGSAFVTRGTKRFNVDKMTRLQSGDIVSTAEGCTLRITADGDKSVWVEPSSIAYIYYTDIASKGDIEVNVTKGSVLCQLDNPLKRKSTFVVKTPNSSVSVKGTVFRVAFNYMDEYRDYKNVMITEVQNFDGTVALQLYDSAKEPYDLPMVLLERTSAQMITAENLCRYGYLNYSFDLLTMEELTLGEMIKISAERPVAFEAEELSSAYKIVKNERLKREQEEATATEATTTSETRPTAATTESVITTTTTETTTPPPTEREEETSYGTLATTMKKHEYTTYSGIKWWEMTGNTNTGTDDYEDWFSPDDDEDFGTVTTVPAGE